MLPLNNSITKELLLNSRSTAITKDLPSPTSIRDPVLLLLLLQPPSNSVMALPIVTTSDTQIALAREKLCLSESTTSTSADSCAAVSTMFAT